MPKVQHSIRQTCAEMLKSATAAKDENQFSISSAEKSDTGSFDEGDFTVVHALGSSKGNFFLRKCVVRYQKSPPKDYKISRLMEKQS